MLCGGTLVFDDTGNLLFWTRKPGTHGKNNEHWAAEIEAGEERRREFLTATARQIAAGRIGVMSGSDQGLLGTRVPPIIADEDGDAVRFHLSPHLHLSEGHQEEDDSGERQWQISC